MGDLLGEDFAVAAKETLSRCLDKLLAHKEELFAFLVERWRDLFGANYDVLLYDLTSTYVESDPPFAAADKRRYGSRRDHRPDCVQVVMALVVTPQGFPLAYEVMPGNTAASTTLPSFLQKIENRYGRARRVWGMDRGIPTEEHWALRRERGLSYLVGTPKGRLSQLEQSLLARPWDQARPSVRVKLLPQEGELYVWVQSQARMHKEPAMRRRQLQRLWAQLKKLQRHRPTYETLLLKVGAAIKEAGRARALVPIAPRPRQVLDKLGALQLLDVHFPTTDGRELIFTRHTQPEKDQLALVNAKRKRRHQGRGRKPRSPSRESPRVVSARVPPRRFHHLEVWTELSLVLNHGHVISVPPDWRREPARASRCQNRAGQPEYPADAGSVRWDCAVGARDISPA